LGGFIIVENVVDNANQLKDEIRKKITNPSINFLKIINFYFVGIRL